MAALVPVNVSEDDAGNVNHPPPDLWRLSATVEGFDDLSFKVRETRFPQLSPPTPHHTRTHKQKPTKTNKN